MQVLNILHVLVAIAMVAFIFVVIVHPTRHGYNLDALVATFRAIHGAGCWQNVHFVGIVIFLLCVE